MEFSSETLRHASLMSPDAGVGSDEVRGRRLRAYALDANLWWRSPRVEWIGGLILNEIDDTSFTGC